MPQPLVLGVVLPPDGEVLMFAFETTLVSPVDGCHVELSSELDTARRR